MNTLLGISNSGSTILVPQKTESCVPETEEKGNIIGTYDNDLCHIKPKNQECKHQVLLRENYLSEFFTKSEKKKVLENLGLNNTVDWGEIGGYIENQPDLFQKLKDQKTQLLASFTFPNESPYDNTGYTLGGLAKGSDIRGKSLMDVFEGLLFPEYLPKFNDATAPTLNYSGSTTRIFEVGSPLPLLQNFSASVGSPASAVAGDYIVYGGGGTCSDIVGSTTAGGEIGNIESITTKKGTCTFSVLCNYSAGTEPIKTSKGNNTQFTSSNTDTLIANGTDSSHTSPLEEGWGLKEINGKSSSITFYYQYKFFATTERVGVLDSGTFKDNLGTWSITLKAGGGSRSMFFIVPPGITVKSIMGYNEISGKYDQNQTANFEISDYVYTLPSKATVIYKKYAYINAPTENFKIQIT